MKHHKTNQWQRSREDFYDDDGPGRGHGHHFPHHHHPHAPPPPPPPPPGPSVEFRSIDGTGNNLTDPTANSANSNFARVGPAHFANDDGHTPIDNGINPRTISNVVVGEGDPDVANPEGVSGIMYAWGQFIDHDLDLSRTDGVNHIDVVVPNGDPLFADGSVISMTRAVIDPTTGTPGNPATAVNSITGWLDASMVYGSSATIAASLRTADGHMKTSAGDNLPIDPVTGQFLAGDVRAAENPSLTALQILFVREHNFQVDQAHEKHPTWTGDQLYQYARAIVAAEIAHITYNEFLPLLVGNDAIGDYQGYDPTVDARITEEFAGAAFRFGHSIVSGGTERIDEKGAVTGAELDLKDAFFMPPADFNADGGADGFLRHLASDPSQAMDGRIVDDLRNFLFDPPVAMDLAAINIERGRDLGLGALNQTREALGLDPYTSFTDLATDDATAAALEQVFGDINLVDLWTGGLSEKHAPGALLGETFQTIIAQQFEALRDGDRLWYENQGFDAKTLKQINGTTLSDLIERNTDTDHMQDDAFVFYNRHSGIKGGVEAEDPDAPQLVIGSKGFDTLIGGPQGDYLVANTGGTQTMTGDQGADKFVIGHGIKGVVTDFKPGEDKIVFDDAGQLDFHDVKIKSDHGNAVVQANGSQITLLGINPYQLHAHDFIYDT